MIYVTGDFHGYNLNTILIVVFVKLRNNDTSIVDTKWNRINKNKIEFIY